MFVCTNIGIQVRIDFGWLDPDPEGQKLPTKKKRKKISCFEVLDVLCY
jgi:hypothetical protein